MPKRVLDGEAIWTSSKLAKVQPAWARGEYAWLHPLAGSNGVFEWDGNAIWAKCYAYARVDKTPEDVRTIGDAFERAKLLFRWQQRGKTWAYWVGSDKRGRLPRRSWVERDRKKGRLGPDPQPEDLRRFLAGDGEIQPGLSFEHASSTPQACPRHASSVPGSGSGSGLGLGTGNGERAAHAPSSEAGASDREVAPRTSGSQQTPKAPPSEAGRQLADRLREWILRNNPTAKVTDSQVRSWAHEADLMMRVDNRTEEQIAGLIEWSQRDSFWKANMLSMGKLREKFDQLTLKKQANEEGGATNGTNRGSHPRGAVPASPGKYGNVPISRIPN